MADTHVGNVDYMNLHNPLTGCLRELEEECKDPYLEFQVAYAAQALMNVSDSESIWHAGFRRFWLVLKGGAGFAKMPDPTEIGAALEGLEKVYLGFKGSYKTIKDIVTYRELPTFTREEGFKFRRAWYRAIRTAKMYIQAGELLQFRDLVVNVSFRHQFEFQWGICQLLGCFIVNPQWDLKVQQEAIAFLRAFHQNEIWEHKKRVDQVIFDVLTYITSNPDTGFEDATSLLDEIKKANSDLAPSPIASLTFRSQGTIHSDNPSNLLKVVQDQIRRNAKIDNLQDPISPSDAPVKIRSVPKTYYDNSLNIQRISGDKLNIDTCYVNLAIVEAPQQREKEKQDLEKKAATFHRFPSTDSVQDTNIASIIPLEQLFDRRKLRDGKDGIPKSILILGRAGIVKTTLCKKLSKSSARRDHVGQALVISTQKGRVLFILDCMDEIIAETETHDGEDLKSFLMKLLSQQHVVITSRPSGLDRSLLSRIDLELETVGFNQQNVTLFLKKVLEPDEAEAVQEFIRRTPLIQGLVNIPVQIDVICFSWESIPKDDTQITITGLYQLMVRKLWCKDAFRLLKKRGEKLLTERQLEKLRPMEIDRLMATEIQYLGYLAFKGMKSNHQIEFDDCTICDAFAELGENSFAEDQLMSSQLVDIMKETSFLHSADTGLDPTNKNEQQTWHFLHLTFQEYFAATWIVRHLQDNKPVLRACMMSNEEMEEFIRENKYNPQYEIRGT
ncbi:hypothetical protein FBU30_008971 [Linnemannia zychae]|nr:hypothetical protein FBU30_008971 [Linnemannia zychae]